MKKYIVCTVTVETRTGKAPLNTMLNNVCQDTDTEKVFDTIEEALAEYEKTNTDVRYSPAYGMPLYIHTCKYIEEAEYGEGGEFIEGGDWVKDDFPDFKETIDNEEDEKIERRTA